MVGDRGLSRQLSSVNTFCTYKGCCQLAPLRQPHPKGLDWSAQGLNLYRLQACSVCAFGKREVNLVNRKLHNSTSILNPPETGHIGNRRGKGLVFPSIFHKTENQSKPTWWPLSCLFLLPLTSGLTSQSLDSLWTVQIFLQLGNRTFQFSDNFVSHFSPLSTKD